VCVREFSETQGHCQAKLPNLLGSFFVIARLPKAAEAILWRGIRLPRTFQVLAMTTENSLMNQATTKIRREKNKGFVGRGFIPRQNRKDFLTYQLAIISIRSRAQPPSPNLLIFNRMWMKL